MQGRNTRVVLLMLLLVALPALVRACCPNACNGHGTCGNKGNGCLCSCFQGFTGADCSRRTCPVGAAWSDTPLVTDGAHQPAVCSGRGACDLPSGRCVCDAGFTGLACNRLACPNDCSRRGECRSMRLHAARKDAGAGPLFRYDGAWDSDMVYGCVCDDGFEGGDCSRRTCATGDDPLTGASTDTRFGFQKNEKQTVACAATGGTFTLSFRGQTTVPISATDRADVFSQKINALPSLRLVTVVYSGTSTTACTADGNFVTVEFTQDFGSLPLLVGNGAQLVHAGVNQSPRLTVSKAEEGTKENEPCSNRGRCDPASGVCTCFLGYTTSNGNGRFGDRGDCGAAETTITACPGDVPCSGHGYCTGAPQFRCLCMDGWSGGDCTVRACPSGAAWFELPIADNRAHQWALCSGVGTCDTTKGECVCPAPFDGAACERMKCPGGDLPCSGNGRCLSMAQRALEAVAPNGEPLAGVTYGATPNDPRTWDFNKIHVCVCDPGFQGHDCAQRSCPRGDNPRTVGQVYERQTLACTHVAPTPSAFRLRFRGAETPWLASNVASTDLQAALEALATTGAGALSVSYSAGFTGACTLVGSASTNRITVQFLTLRGALPPLRVEVASAALAQVPTFVVNTGGAAGSATGTVEDAECSNNGLCQYATGRCACFEGMASSDGTLGGGTAGLRLDCGYVVPVVDPLAQNAAMQG